MNVTCRSCAHIVLLTPYDHHNPIPKWRCNPCLNASPPNPPSLASSLSHSPAAPLPRHLCHCPCSRPTSREQSGGCIAHPEHFRVVPAWHTLSYLVFPTSAPLPYYQPSPGSHYLHPHVRPCFVHSLVQCVRCFQPQAGHIANNLVKCLVSANHQFS